MTVVPRACLTWAMSCMLLFVLCTVTPAMWTTLRSPSEPPLRTTACSSGNRRTGFSKSRLEVAGAEQRQGLGVRHQQGGARAHLDLLARLHARDLQRDRPVHQVDDLHAA